MKPTLTRTLTVVLAAIQLVACGGGGGSDDSAGLTGSSGTSEVTASSVSLTWVAPFARADGSPLSLAEIGGYRVYYGTTAGDYPNSVDVADSSAGELELTDLAPGTYYFVVTTYDTAGRESEHSSEVVKTL